MSRGWRSKPSKEWPPGCASSRPGSCWRWIDDGSWTDYTVKKPIFDAHGAVAVSAVISSRRFLTDSQLLAMQAAGWEIASHSRAHLDETRLTGAQLEEEIGGAKRDLEQVGL